MNTAPSASGGGSGTDSENGAYRGHRTNFLTGVANYLANVILGAETGGREVPSGAFGGVAPGAYGGGSDVPLTKGERKLLCTMKNSIPDEEVQQVNSWLSSLLGSLLRRDDALVNNALESAACEKALSGRSTYKVVTIASEPFPVDEAGVPVSSNTLWNDCIRGHEVTLQELRANPEKDGNGVPLTCGDYHTQDDWIHPDLHVHFIWDRLNGRFSLPDGYHAAATTSPVPAH